MSEPTIPFGPTKGTPLSQAAIKDLKYCIDRRAADLDENPDSQYAASNKRWLDAAMVELQRREGGGAPAAAPAATGAAKPSTNAQPAPSTALAQVEPSAGLLVEGSFGDAARATSALRAAAERCHLVAPATICGSLPEGCEIALSMVVVDPYGPEVYQITGNRKQPGDDDTVGIDRVSLAKIGGAAGINWEVSRRTDDASDPHYCAWEAVALVRMFDGQLRRVVGNVELDAREGSPLLEEIRIKASRRQGDNDGGASQILELRKFLSRHAESKAMNRAIASLGVRRSYKRKDLKKPFAVARIMFTGRSEDPEARREFRAGIMNSFLGNTAALYGGNAPVQTPAPAQLQPSPVQAAPAAFALSAPPPVGSVGAQGYDIEAEGDEAPDSPRKAPAPAPAVGAEQPAATAPADAPKAAASGEKF
jgi:hypothetical protein